MLLPSAQLVSPPPRQQLLAHVLLTLESRSRDRLPQDQFVLSDFRFLGVVNYKETVANPGTEPASPPPTHTHTLRWLRQSPRSTPQKSGHTVVFLIVLCAFMAEKMHRSQAKSQTSAEGAP